MLQELEQKLLRLKAEYPDGELPMKARHAIDLFEDITALLFAQYKWTERISNEIGTKEK